MSSNTISPKDVFKRLAEFINAGGPEENEYAELTSLWNNLQAEENCNSTASAKSRMEELFDGDFLSNTIQGFSYRKPHGYAGDFEVIDNVYQYKMTADKRFEKWDKFFHAQQATQAVRNRKDYFINLVKEKCSKTDKPLRILNIASGPCRDVLELLEQVPAEKLKIRCVEIDPKAIRYSKDLLGAYSDVIEFTQANIFKFDTEEKFDLIWSAGLFDYFDNKTFTRLLSKIAGWSAPSGKIVIGNFSADNPTRSFMEQALQWYLFHRLPGELAGFAIQAGFKPHQVAVQSEALGINLFLHMQAA